MLFQNPFWKSLPALQQLRLILFCSWINSSSLLYTHTIFILFFKRKSAQNRRFSVFMYCYNGSRHLCQDFSPFFELFYHIRPFFTPLPASAPLPVSLSPLPPLSDPSLMSCNRS